MRNITVRHIVAAGALSALALLAGCGQEIKKENEQLKAQVATLQKENADLKNQVAAAKAEAEKKKQDMETATKEWQAKIDELNQMLTKRGPAKAATKR